MQCKSCNSFYIACVQQINICKFLKISCALTKKSVTFVAVLLGQRLVDRLSVAPLQSLRQIPQKSPGEQHQRHIIVWYWRVDRNSPRFRPTSASCLLDTQRHVFHLSHNGGCPWWVRQIQQRTKSSARSPVWRIQLWSSYNRQSG